MLFMTQILKKAEGAFSKGTSQFDSEKEALSNLYTAMSSAMAKDDTKQIVCIIVDENGTVIKREKYAVPDAPVEVPVESPEEPAE